DLVKNYHQRTKTSPIKTPKETQRNLIKCNLPPLKSKTSLNSSQSKKPGQISKHRSNLGQPSPLPPGKKFQTTNPTKSKSKPSPQRPSSTDDLYLNQTSLAPSSPNQSPAKPSFYSSITSQPTTPLNTPISANTPAAPGTTKCPTGLLTHQMNPPGFRPPTPRPPMEYNIHPLSPLKSPKLLDSPQPLVTSNLDRLPPPQPPNTPFPGELQTTPPGALLPRALTKLTILDWPEQCCQFR